MTPERLIDLARQAGMFVTVEMKWQAERWQTLAKLITDEPKVGAGETAIQWVCPRCKVDRLKEDCKGDRMTCPMAATAQVHNVEVTGAAQPYRAASRERSERGRP